MVYGKHCKTERGYENRQMITNLRTKTVGLFDSKTCAGNDWYDIPWYKYKENEGKIGLIETALEDLWLKVGIDTRKWEVGTWGGLDLNEKAGGKYIFLCNQNTTSQDQQSAIKEIAFIVSDSNDPSWDGYQVNPQDLNAGAGGKYIFIAWKK